MAEANSRSIELTLCLVPMAALLEHSAVQAETLEVALWHLPQPPLRAPIGRIFTSL